MKRLHIIVYGKVQGVFYRGSAVKQAKSLGLNGWVKNLEDGSVELLAEGEDGKLAAFLEWCKEGPEDAEVYGFQTNWSDYKAEFSDFAIMK